jgi:hypothetical protein
VAFLRKRTRRGISTYTTSGDHLSTQTTNQSTVKGAEVQEAINSLNPKKSSGYDLITGKILKEFPIIRIKYLAQLFNAVLLKGYFPA